MPCSPNENENHDSPTTKCELLAHLCVKAIAAMPKKESIAHSKTKPDDPTHTHQHCVASCICQLGCHFRLDIPEAQSENCNSVKDKHSNAMKKHLDLKPVESLMAAFL